MSRIRGFTRIPLQFRHMSPQISISSSFATRSVSTDRTVSREISTEPDQTDFSALDIYKATAAPSTAIDACMHLGFALNNGQRITNAGVLLIAGEAFAWKTQARGMYTPLASMSHTQLELEDATWGMLDLVWPKPDLLIIGTGSRTMQLSVRTREKISKLGIRVEMQDTRNAAAQYNMLATERGTRDIAAALLPIIEA